MPKDLIHFKVAERMAGMLADTRYAAPLAGEPDGLLLGAVAHDALFYSLRKGAHSLERLAHRFHGVDGNDTAELLRLQLTQIRLSAKPELATALLAGMISHLFADAAMHPMVWHFTGQYYHEDPAEQSLARQRHRVIEGIMDRISCPEMFNDPPYFIKTLLRNSPDMISEGLPVGGLADMAGVGPETVREELRKSWTLFATVQRACFMRPLGWTLFALRPVLPDSVREVAALLHAPQHMRQAAPLFGGIEYLDPVNGTRLRASLNELQWQAARSAAEFCRGIEDAVFDGAEALMPEALPSLETGLHGVPANRMRHFASPPFPHLS